MLLGAGVTPNLAWMGYALCGEFRQGCTGRCRARCRGQNQTRLICTAQDRAGGRMRSDVLQQEEVCETETRASPRRLFSLAFCGRAQRMD